MKQVLVFTMLMILAAGCGDQADQQKNGSSLSLSSLMSGEEDSLYMRAFPGGEFTFPADHGPHPGYKTEWWYFTGNLVSDEGREFGYQFTIFRTAVSPHVTRSGGWLTNNIYMGHFALTDISGEKFYYFERFSRDGNNLAGAQASPLKVWLEDWNIEERSYIPAMNFPQVQLSAAGGDVSINLSLDPVKPLVLQGDRGYSRKGDDPGNASFYYSLPRLRSEGKIYIRDESFTVKGSSWLDREWSTSALSEDQQGWDWFSLQFDDGSEMMYYQLRKKDGTADRWSKGLFIYPDGTTRLLKKEDVNLTVTEFWENDEGDRYPSGWKLEVPSEKLSLEIVPAVKDQELKVTVRYWEGAVRITGTKSGKGYAELTGYSK
ncbi:MAG: carotenoid 1,2-hydratase [Ignavibacteriales bacterium]|nr:MAG: carotenoid 1,2-hydratase [Ignavibacteriales bacterium]